MVKRSMAATILIAAICAVAIITVIGWILMPKLSVPKSTTSTNDPFRVELTDDVVQPIRVFDAEPASAAVYNHVTVYTASGQKVVLGADQQPLLFAAYWCPHCQRTLVLLQQNWGKLQEKPVLVSMGFAPGTTLDQAKALEQDEEKQLHLTHFQVYYLLGNDPTRYVQVAYPTLAFSHNGKIMTIHSEHSLSIWQQALLGM